jgi:hypothetical protein
MHPSIMDTADHTRCKIPDNLNQVSTTGMTFRLQLLDTDS